MRNFMLPAIAVLTIGASGPDEHKTKREPAETSLGGQVFSREQLADAAGENCRDRIHLVRAERDLPELETAPATPDDALLIAAVDHQIDGCDVLVMRNDTSDVRPLPKFDDKTVELIPAN